VPPSRSRSTVPLRANVEVGAKYHVPVGILESQKGCVLACVGRVLAQVPAHLPAQRSPWGASRPYGVVPVVVYQLPGQAALQQPSRERLHVVRIVWRRLDLHDRPAASPSVVRKYIIFLSAYFHSFPFISDYLDFVLSGWW
jgi:hypothetical protein